MSDSSLQVGSLVLYKIHPALVRGIGEKIEISLADGKSKKVRAKDVQLLHPGPLSSLQNLQPPVGNVEEAWELLQGEQPSLAELAELVFGDFSPASAWATWELLQDGVYFAGATDAIEVRELAQVQAEQQARAEREREAREWDEFLARVSAAKLEDSDRKRLAEVERVALAQAEHSKILQSFDVAVTPESAHAFLLRCGYWELAENPWPRRSNLQLAPVELAVPPLADEVRRDLTDLSAWAIDDVGNTDPDDAISLDGDRLWVHIADVAALVRPDGHLDLAARERSSNLYLPEQVYTMLPLGMTEQLGLGLAAESPALSIGFRFDGAQICDVEVAISRVRVQRDSYDAVDKRMHEEPFAAIAKITDAYRAQRLARNAARLDLPEASVKVREGEVLIRPLPKLPSRDMVTDAMLMAGEAVALYAQQHGLVIPYAMQPEPEEIRQPSTVSDMFAYRRLFKPSKTVLEAEPHFGLGLQQYARSTSPLRRYADLLVHQQLRAHVTGRDPLTREQMVERVATVDMLGGRIRRTERQSNLHWKLVYLAGQPNWRGEAIVAALEERRAALLIPELAMEIKMRLHDSFVLDGTVNLQLRDVNITAQEAYFRIL